MPNKVQSPFENSCPVETQEIQCCVTSSASSSGDVPEVSGGDAFHAGQFQILEKTGRGASADVYKAKYGGNTVALKVLRHNQEEQRKRTVLFFREAQALQSCQHTNVIGFQGLFRLPGSISNQLLGESVTSWVMVQEFAEKGCLAQLVARQSYDPEKPLYSRTEALSWGLDLSSALRELHSREPKYIHRDVKLDNVLLCVQGARTVAKLCDFGLHVVAPSSKAQVNIKKRSYPSTRLTYQSSAVSQNSISRVSTNVSDTSGHGSRPLPDQSVPVSPDRSYHKRNSLSNKALGASSRSMMSDLKFCNVSVHGRTPSEVWNEIQEQDVVVEFDKVFCLTGVTGSYYYMAPEVFRNELYNEKADVFSFGIVLYELLARERVAVASSSENCESSRAYAEQVSRGYRPPRRGSICDVEWTLIEACLAADAGDRPSMVEVCEYLQDMLTDIPEALPKKCGCIVC